MNAPPPPLPPSSSDRADTKLRLMCRYGGQIVPRPRSNSLYYLGGETRIVSLNRKTVNDFSSFVSHLTSSLSIQSPLSIKYQLPSHELDSLLPLSSDEDFHLMLEDQFRFSSSGRIRLFLFFSNPKSMKIRNVIHHPKTEDWFVDALKSAKILQKAGDRLVDFDGERVNGISGLAESMVLDTSSSFGSSSSSASLSNVPPIKAQEEDGLVNLLDNIVKLPSSESIATLSSDSGFQPAGSASDSKISSHQEVNFKVSSDENCISANHVNLGNKTYYIHDHCATNPVHNLYDLSGLHEPTMLPQNFSSILPSSSYYPIHHQMFHYQPNPVYPFYVLPQVTSPNNFPAHFSLPQYRIQPLIHGNSPLILPQVTYNESSEIPSTRNIHVKPYDEGEEDDTLPPQSCFAQCNEISNVIEEFDDGLEHAQIYRSQPPPPSFPSHLQVGSKASKISLP